MQPSLIHDVDSRLASCFALLMLLRSCAAAAASCAALLAGPIYAQDADALRARHAALEPELAANSFGRPLHVGSSEGGARHTGDVEAVLDKPFRVVGSALQGPDHWCEILMLIVNNRKCEAGPDRLIAFITRKPRDPLDNAYRVEFNYDVATTSDDYLRVSLAAKKGPVGTTDYRIVLEAAPLDARRTYLRMSYSYTLSVAARIAMQSYLATAGRDKVGFTVVGRSPEGEPVYVDGARGLIERNAMRYYLAIEAYLEALDAPPSQRLEQRLRDWYASIERYPRQLHEDVDRDEYLRIKRQEAQRTASAAAAY